MKYLPTDVSSFVVMRTGNYIYIDKTEYIYNLFQGGTRYYFLSRPRRFGKSLLVSTMQELFKGNKKLFEGLWIENSPYDWQEYPVIYLDFSSMGYETPEELKKSLASILDDIAKHYDVKIKKTNIIKLDLKYLIEALAQKNKVVLLIDEYDKPILDHINDLQKSASIRNILSDFFSSLKGMDDYMRAIFITGVTKFAKTSLFSGINNLNDISIKPEASEILGYRYEEINHYFYETIKEISLINNNSIQETIDRLRKWYNGYKFSNKDTKVYNPFSILYYMKDKLLRNYWFESGTPTFLISLLKNQYEDLPKLLASPIKPSSLTAFDLKDIPLVPLLFQTGYLTFDQYDPIKDTFTLRFPNREVEESFTEFLVAAMSNRNKDIVNVLSTDLINALDANNLDDFCAALKTLFAKIPYTLHIEREAYYHSLFQFLLNLLSIESHAEMLTNKGRIDLILSTASYIYIFELKLNDAAQNALSQIHEKKYYEAFLNKGKKIILVGMNFITKKQHFDIEYITETYTKNNHAQQKTKT